MTINNDYKGKMTNYNNSKIYKIQSHVGEKIYIGSTTKKLLCDRMTGHRYDYKRWKNGDKSRVYKSFEMFDEYGLENCKIILIENYPCNSRDELTSREAHHIRNTVCVNKYIPDRTREEYRNESEHKERKAVLSKARHQEKKEMKLAGITTAPRDTTNQSVCECGGRFRPENKRFHLKTEMHIRHLSIPA